LARKPVYVTVLPGDRDVKITAAATNKHNTEETGQILSFYTLTAFVLSKKNRNRSL